jgi:hypothetical protein
LSSSSFFQSLPALGGLVARDLRSRNHAVTLDPFALPGGIFSLPVVKTPQWGLVPVVSFLASGSFTHNLLESLRPGLSLGGPLIDRLVLAVVSNESTVSYHFWTFALRRPGDVARERVEGEADGLKEEDGGDEERGSDDGDDDEDDEDDDDPMTAPRKNLFEDDEFAGEI